MSGGLDTLEDLFALATSRGLVVREPASDELFIDIDSEAAYERFKDLFCAFCEYGVAWVRSTTPSPSGAPGHYHVVVQLMGGPLDAEERIVLQALLGSDTKRELLAYMQLRRGKDPRAASVFLERPGVL